MTARNRLPNRRYHETVAVEFEEQRFKIGLGREASGHAAEVFINAQKPNSPLDCLASDGAILMSLLLQHGCDAATIAHAMKKNPDGSPASVLGCAAHLLKEEA